jgi:hypothetical protein
MLLLHGQRVAAAAQAAEEAEAVQHVAAVLGALRRVRLGSASVSIGLTAAGDGLQTPEPARWRLHTAGLQACGEGT